jgi:hypothetical protein
MTPADTTEQEPLDVTRAVDALNLAVNLRMSMADEDDANGRHALARVQVAQAKILRDLSARLSAMTADSAAVDALLLDIAGEYIGDQECSCEHDQELTCWYHLSDDERVAWVVQHIVSREAISVLVRHLPRDRMERVAREATSAASVTPNP